MSIQGYHIFMAQPSQIPIQVLPEGVIGLRQIAGGSLTVDPVAVALGFSVASADEIEALAVPRDAGRNALSLSVEADLGRMAGSTSQAFDSVNIKTSLQALDTFSGSRADFDAQYYVVVSRRTPPSSLVGFPGGADNSKATAAAVEKLTRKVAELEAGLARAVKVSPLDLELNNGMAGLGRSAAEMTLPPMGRLAQPTPLEISTDAEGNPQAELRQITGLSPTFYPITVSTAGEWNAAVNALAAGSEIVVEGSFTLGAGDTRAINQPCMIYCVGASKITLEAGQPLAVAADLYCRVLNLDGEVRMADDAYATVALSRGNTSWRNDDGSAESFNAAVLNGRD